MCVGMCLLPGNIKALTREVSFGPLRRSSSGGGGGDRCGGERASSSVSAWKSVGEARGHTFESCEEFRRKR